MENLRTIHISYLYDNAYTWSFSHISGLFLSINVSFVQWCLKYYSTYGNDFSKKNFNMKWNLDFTAKFFSRHDRGETTTMTLERNGLFDVSVHRILEESDFKPETIFECSLSIPGTSFSMKADSLYFKGQRGNDTLHKRTIRKLCWQNLFTNFFIRYFYFVKTSPIFKVL